MKIRKFYDMISPVYPFISFLDSESREKGLRMAKVEIGETVLCIGFGSGKELEYFCKKGCNVIGLDCSEKIVKRYGNEDCVIGDIRDLPFSEKTFDIVYSAFVVDLFEDRDTEDILFGLGRILKDNGRIVLVTNCDEKGLGKYLVWFYNWRLILNCFERFYAVLDK